MGKAEQLLKLAADSHRMPGWEDSLSYIVDKARGGMQVLSDEDLQNVAGGAINNSHEYLEMIKARIGKK